MTEEEARKRVKKEKEFYGHLASFVMVNVMLVAVNLFTSPGHLWFIYPLFGWGIGLASHAASVYGLGVLGEDWEERKVRELMAKERADDLVTADQLEQRLRQRPTPRAEDVDVGRLLRRVEHLEAIVTSRDWDDLAGRDKIEATSEDPPSNAEKTANLAQRVE